jgi:hypothetical protein
MLKGSIFFCAFLAMLLLGASRTAAQTSASGQAISVATPTPVPVGTASTALNSSLTGGGVINGKGTMGMGVNVPQPSEVAPIVPGSIVINSNASSVGTGNVAGSVQVNNGGAGSVTGAPVPVSPIPTYVTPGTGLGTAASAGSTSSNNPNPGSVQ